MKIDKHYFVVLSGNEANKNINTFIGVMITTSNKYYDDYSFDVEEGMFDPALPKESSHIRMSLVSLCIDNKIIGQRKAVMKERFFCQLMETIGDLMFGFEFKRMK